MELKKNENRQVSKFRTLFLNVGLVVTLILTITAFEWQWAEMKIVLDLEKEGPDIIEVMAKVTEQKLPQKPEPPKPQSKIILDVDLIEIDDFEKLNKPIEDFKPTVDDITSLIASTEAPPEIVDNKVYGTFEVEKSAIPLDGMEQWYRNIAAYCSANLREQDKLRHGKVHVSFVIERDGTVTDFKILKGIHSRIDAMVINSIKKAGLWKPAKQGARPVRQRLTMPINFQ